MSVVDRESYEESTNKKIKNMFFKDGNNRLKTEFMGKTCGGASLYLVTNASHKEILTNEGLSNTYQGDIPRLFIVESNSDNDNLLTRRYVDIETGTLLLNTKHAEYQRKISKDTFRSEWIVNDVCNAVFNIFVCSIKLKNNSLIPYYYPNFVLYDDKEHTFHSGGVSLQIRNKGYRFILKFHTIGYTFVGELNLNKIKNYKPYDDGMLPFIDINTVMSWTEKSLFNSNVQI